MYIKEKDIYRWTEREKEGGGELFCHFFTLKITKEEGNNK